MIVFDRFRDIGEIFFGTSSFRRLFLFDMLRHIDEGGIRMDKRDIDCIVLLKLTNTWLLEPLCFCILLHANYFCKVAFI